MLRVVLAGLHLLGLGIGLGAIWSRARAFRGPFDAASLRRLFAADSWWGLAAVLWIGSGLWRLLAGTEKPTAYYLHNEVFWLKMTALAAILVLEVGPMVTLYQVARLDRAGYAGRSAPGAHLRAHQLHPGGPGGGHGGRGRAMARGMVLFVEPLVHAGGRIASTASTAATSSPSARTFTVANCR